MTYARTPEQKARYAAAARRRRADPAYKAARAERRRQHRLTPEGRAALIEAERRYRTSPHGRRVRDACNRRWRYGVTGPAYEALLIAQSGLCAACDLPMKAPEVDHDHETNEARELLCGPCNRTAGQSGDNVTRLRAVADYLERHAA